MASKRKPKKRNHAPQEVSGSASITKKIDLANHLYESNQKVYEDVRSTSSEFHSNNDSLSSKYYTENEFVFELNTHRGLSLMHINMLYLLLWC